MLNESLTMATQPTSHPYPHEAATIADAALHLLSQMNAVAQETLRVYFEVRRRVPDHQTAAWRAMVEQMSRAYEEMNAEWITTEFAQAHADLVAEAMERR